MTIQTINLGNYANDGTGDDLRTAFEKVNSNFSFLGNNDASSVTNIGGGTGLFAQKVGADLQFKTLVGSGGVTLTHDGSTVTISSPIALVNDTAPSLGGDLNLNGHNIVGDIQTTIYGIDVRVLANQAAGTLDFGGFTSPSTYNLDQGSF